MYLGNNLQVAFPSYTNIDDISGSFNGSTTSFALTVNGAAPVPFPLSSNQCLISVNGVVQRPDDSGTEGFRLSGGNIIFSAAPGSGQDFFGVILAGSDYVNVGVRYPAGSSSTPSITFDNDLDTGLYNPGANQLGVTCGTTTSTVFTATGYSFLAGSAGAPGLYPAGDTNTGFYSPGADQLGITTGGTLRLSLSTTAITSALPFLSALGSNTAPSYSFTGDVNTGLYSPGADQLGLATGGTLRFSVGSNGVVTVKNGAVAEIGTLTDGATITPNFAANCNFTVTIGGNRTIANPSNLTAGQSGSIFLVQDGSGSRTVSWDSYWVFPGGVPPILSTAPGSIDRVDYIVRSSTSIHTVFTANYP